ncbi:hypothetical protein BDZ88DRAFT_431914 [Geranomyces variabilis]|nr:hypothetical protein BDZ88DRAFT_431914 [Geranomyces variabilis]KAJ3142738.1 hypothetical protein HDU90_002609 [Geranomyces variabilis]
MAAAAPQPPPPLTPEIQAARWAGFCESITYVLRGWTGLQIAIDAQMAGHYTSQTSAELHSHMVAFFQQYGTEVMPHEIAQNLEAYFDEVFHANLDDGSPTQIGEKLCRLYKEIVCEGRRETFDAVKEVASRAAGRTAGVRQGGGDSDSSDDSDDGSSGDEDAEEGGEASADAMVVDPPAEPRQRRPDPVVDEDGFETVQKKGRRRN